MGSFSAWIKNKLKPHQRRDLLDDLLEFMDEDDKAELLDELATELGDDGYDFDDIDEDEETTDYSLACKCYDCGKEFGRHEVRPRGTAYICIPCDDDLDIPPTEE